ncbi:MAG: hypothetical protein CSA62_08065 [Planctomycetota bacterium]|nr:MAG: hypothetical protein CSA62_08065 [Planctomycetota bacterium]
MIEPVRMTQPSPELLLLTWKDGMESLHRGCELRRKCPCAGCIDEFTGAPILDPSTVPDDIQIRKIEVVGRYALRFLFSDGHDTGLFTFKFLRELAVKAQGQD